MCGAFCFVIFAIPCARWPSFVKRFFCCVVFWYRAWVYRMNISRRLFFCLVFLFEMCLWLLPAGVFLFIYVYVYEASPTVLLPHGVVLLSLWLGLFSLRLVNWRFARGVGVGVQVQKNIALVLLVFPPLVLSVWYVVMLVGLMYWGRVATWQLLQVYFFQSYQLSAVLGFSGWFFIAVLVLCLFLIFLLCRSVSRLDWCKEVSMRLSVSGLSLVSMLGLAVVGVQFMRLSGLVDLHPQEPIGISLFSNHSALLQSHSVVSSPLIDADEVKATDSYVADRSFSARNVILIVGDALRADHMGIYGYHRPTTPHLQASALRRQTLVNVINFGNYP